MKDQDEKMYEYAGWMAKYGGYANDMTMRDHLAGLAMQALAPHNSSAWEVARAAYNMADVMLKVRDE
jgi:hypothetical protein